jgi:hypothetical protein
VVTEHVGGPGRVGHVLSRDRYRTRFYDGAPALRGAAPHVPSRCPTLGEKDDPWSTRSPLTAVPGHLDVGAVIPVATGSRSR